MVWEVVQEYGLLNISSNELRGNEKKRQVLAGVMSSLGQPILDTGCLKCFKDAVKTLNRLHQSEMAKQTKRKPKQQYRMVKGPNFYLNGFGWVNADNCTDELAKKIIAKNEANRYLFNE